MPKLTNLVLTHVMGGGGDGGKGETRGHSDIWGEMTS